MERKIRLDMGGRDKPTAVSLPVAKSRPVTQLLRPLATLFLAKGRKKIIKTQPGKACLAAWPPLVSKVPRPNPPARKPVPRPTSESTDSTALFIQECLRKPAQMGALAPSSPRLAKAMAHWLPEDPKDYVIELGPGTGVVTEALLARGLCPARLLAIEKSPELAAMLQKRFPQVRVIAGDAGEMDALLHQHTGERRAGAVISSLPLRSFPKELETRVTRKIHEILKPGGCWVQFTYHTYKRWINGSQPFDFHSTKYVFWNLPPARVLRYKKKSAPAPVK
jgi:phosphatidylethanolamine/phosphatidyl-N-methylethanolamine N-methyltransferase